MFFVQLEFDPSVTDFKSLLDIFWSGHDSTVPAYSRHVFFTSTTFSMFIVQLLGNTCRRYSATEMNKWGLHRNHWRRHRSTWRRRSKPWFNQPDLFTRRKSESWGSVLFYMLCLPATTRSTSCRSTALSWPRSASPAVPNLLPAVSRQGSMATLVVMEARFLLDFKTLLMTHNTPHPSQESFLEETETVNQLNQDDVDYVADAIEQAVSRRYS